MKQHLLWSFNLFSVFCISFCHTSCSIFSTWHLDLSFDNLWDSLWKPENNTDSLSIKPKSNHTLAWCVDGSVSINTHAPEKHAQTGRKMLFAPKLPSICSTNETLYGKLQLSLLFLCYSQCLTYVSLNSPLLNWNSSQTL